MNNDGDITYEIIEEIYYKGIKPLIIEKDSYAYINDPVFKIKRNRVIAEILKTITRYELEKDEKIITKLTKYLGKTQNQDGSWNEIHPNYNQPSALITSIISEALLIIYEKFPDTNLEKKIHLASDYVLSQKKTPGYFIKSKNFTADHLNVDATCGAFLAFYGKSFSKDQFIRTAEETAKHILDNQFSDGVYPYTITKGNYQYNLNIPCIHYQGVTMYYLSKINDVINKDWLRNSLIRGAEWLSKEQKNDGRFDWSKSGHIFSQYLSGAYAFAFSSFTYVSRWDDKYLKNAKLCLEIIKKNIDILCLRWEKDTWLTFPFAVPVAMKTALIGNYPFKYKLFRFGYSLYRQIARRRFSDQIDERFFKNLSNLLNVESSTIEPFSNYPDLFMTSEVLDCLSSYKLFFRGDPDNIQ